MTRTVLAVALLLLIAAPAHAQKPDRNAPPPNDGTHYEWANRVLPPFVPAGRPNEADARFQRYEATPMQPPVLWCGLIPMLMGRCR